MKRRLTIGILAVAVAAVFPTGALASETITIEPTPGANAYAPASATVDLGDTFTWQWGPDGKGATDSHNVIQNASLFTSGLPVESQPPYTLTASAGSYHYLCAVHLGMEGDVAVRPALAGADTGSGPIAVSWATSSTTTGNRFDVRYRTGKKWKTWQKKTQKKAGKFGKKKKPAKVKKGRTYEFQARSRQGKHKSAWSPTLIVTR